MQYGKREMSTEQFYSKQKVSLRRQQSNEMLHQYVSLSPFPVCIYLQRCHMYRYQSSSVTCLTDLFIMRVSWTAFNWSSVNIQYILWYWCFSTEAQDSTGFTKQLIIQRIL